jgi:hypothetical protein
VEAYSEVSRTLSKNGSTEVLEKEEEEVAEKRRKLLIQLKEKPIGAK